MWLVSDPRDELLVVVVGAFYQASKPHDKSEGGVRRAAPVVAVGPVSESGKLRDSFLERLQQIVPDAILNGPSVDNRHPGNANVRFSKRSAHTLLGALQPHLAASTGSACTSGIPEPSHVLRAIGLSEPDAEASVRFSIGRSTTADDVVVAIDLIKEAICRTGELNLGQAS